MYQSTIKKLFNKIMFFQSTILLVTMLMSIVIANSIAGILNSITIGDSNGAIDWLILFLFFSGLQITLKFGTSLYINKCKLKSIQSLQEILYRNYLCAPIRREANKTSGDILILLQKDVSQIAKYYSFDLPSFVQAMVGLLCYSVYFIFFLKSWTVLLILFVIGLLQFLPPFIMRKYLIQNYIAAGEAESELIQWVISGISGFATLKAFDLHNWFMEKYGNRQTSFQRIGKMAAVTSAVQASMEHLVNFIQQIGLAILLGTLLLFKWINFSIAVQCIALSGNYYSYLKTIFSANINKNLAQQAIHRILNGIPWENRVDFKGSPEVSGHLVIDGLCYQVNDNRFFDGLCIDFGHTGIWLIKGANGIGKSTLFYLLLCELEGSSGEIRWGRTKISSENAYQYFSFCPQLPLVTNMSAGELIDMVPERKERILKILNYFKVDCNLLFQSLKALSGGERKKIMLAICFANPAPILLLDEPEASLDQGSVKLLRDYMQNVENERIIIMISHDNSLERLAKEVLWIRDDRVILKETRDLDEKL